VQHEDPDVLEMLAFSRGDEEAFVRLYQAWRHRIFNFSRRLLGDAAAGEEAAQEVFLKLYQARRRYQPRSRFSTFLYRIAANHCIKVRELHDRKRTDREADMDRHVSAAAGGEAQAARAQLREALLRAFRALPDRQGAAFLLCHYDGLSYREAADALGVSEGAVKSLVHRARAALVEKLGSWMEKDIAHALEPDHAL
jgi:RNA polymerase sigma-70 factor, ECF subfamily